jgi:SAM-dependent methyltransferase
MPIYYTSKAEKYARFRWDYATAAIETIFRLTGLNGESTAADVGAGTGILTRHFVGQVARLVAFEPDPGMLRFLGQALAGKPGCLAAAAIAERIPLPTGCLDALLVAQAIHWFDPEPTRAEFTRLLKPGGWLVVLRNASVDHPPGLGAAVAALNQPEYGVRYPDRPSGPRARPVEFFFGPSGCQKLVFPFAFGQDWEGFIGAANSAAYTPEVDHPLYLRYEQGMRAVFDSFSQAGTIEVRGETELVLGQMV